MEKLMTAALQTQSATQSTIQSATQTIDDALQAAVVCHRAGQLQQAEALYQAVLQVQPSNPEANHNVGLLRVQAGQVEAGLSNFLAAIEAEPTVAQYWQSYIEALLLAGRGNDARVVFEHARRHGLKGPGIEELATKLLTAPK
jgi:Tfp pilus assembly protein PilF